MSTSAIASVIEIMESVPVPVQERIAERVRDYVLNGESEATNKAGATENARSMTGSDELRSDFARRLAALPTLPRREGTFTTMALVNELRDRMD